MKIRFRIPASADAECLPIPRKPPLIKRSIHFLVPAAFLPPVAVSAAEGSASFDGPLLTREHLGGDWFGTRDRLAGHGLDVKFEWTQFFFGLADGTGPDDITDGGRTDLFLNLDGHKAGLWPGLFASVHGEFRYGDVTRQAGALSMANTSMMFPASDGDVFAFTNVTLTQAFSESVLLTVGKFNFLDDYEKEFLGGRGVEGFMNINLVAPPIVGRTVPLSTLGAMLTVLDEGKPVFDLGIIDARSPMTSSGFDGLSSDEITILADYTFRTKINGLDGIHTLSGTWSSIDAVSLDSSDFIRPPLALIPVPTRKDDSWQINYLYEQYLCQAPSNPAQGLGFFVLLGLSDGNPNPYEWTATAGFSAKGIGDLRPHDRAGLGFFYADLSDDLRGTLAPFVPLRDEYGVELYYDCAITPWFRLAANVQVIRPAVEANDTAVFAGLRSRVIF